MRALLVVAALVVVAAPAAADLPARTDTTIGVLSDQLPDGLSPGLLRFAATHYAGAQKLGRSETRALKAIDPRFFMIQYRLALGLGRRTSLRFGDAWRPEWPAHPQEQWLYLADGTNHKVWILRRSDLEIVGEFGRGGRQVGQMLRPHGMSIDSHGNLYVGEASG